MEECSHTLGLSNKNNIPSPQESGTGTNFICAVPKIERSIKGL
jgi:hypothetical protein